MTACGTSGSIELLSDASVSTGISIPSNASISIDLKGYTITAALGSTSANLFTLSSGASLSLANGNLTSSDNLGRAVYASASGSSLSLDGVAVSGFSTSDNGGAIYMYGASLTIKSCSFTSCSSVRSGGAIYVSSVPSVNITSSSFSDNVAGTAKSSRNYGGGDIYLISSSTSGTIDSCTFSNSKSSESGGSLCLYYVGTFTIKGSKFTNCTAQDLSGSNTDGSNSGTGGGAIWVCSPSNLSIEKCEMAGCYSRTSGGALYIVNYSAGCVTTLSDNWMYDNTAGKRGGGISIAHSSSATTAVKILSGVIEGNKARWGGGIDYTTHYMPVLELDDVLVTGNTAPRGGGVWICPAGTLEAHSTFGGAIYGNTATGSLPAWQTSDPSASGDDIRFEGSDAADSDAYVKGSWNPNNDAHVTVSRRVLGGGFVQWYNDDIGDRYEEGDDLADPLLYTRTQKSFGLHAELSEEDQALAEKNAKIIIRNNTATERGGGIAANSVLQFGQESSDLSMEVTKTWDNELTEHPDSITVNLVQIETSTGTRTVLDGSKVLSVETEWKAYFYDLPAYYEDEDGVDHPYRYEVEEVIPEGWTWECEETTSRSEDGRTVYVSLVNKNVEETPEEPDEPDTPEEPDEPDTPDTPDTPDEPEQPSSSESEAAEIPATGDGTPIALALALAIAAACCALVVGGIRFFT